jgi:hypothetical protein
VENLKERAYLGEADMDDRVVLHWILEKQGVKMQTEIIWLKVWYVTAVMNFHIP